MNILICDDLPEETAALDVLLQHSGFPVHTKIFHHAPSALEFIRTGALVDLCFLDIVMPELSGIELAEALRQGGYGGEIVFLSTSKEYGPESYAVDAFSYLLKPPTAESVKAILRKLTLSRNSSDQMEIVVKSEGVARVIPHRTISHAEAMGHHVILHLRDGREIYVHTTFSEIAGELLLDSRFIRCHRSYVVNMQDVAEISEREIFTHCGKRVPIPRTYRDTRRKFYKWKFGGACK